MSSGTAALLGIAAGAFTVNLLSIPYWLWRARRPATRQPHKPR